MMKLRLGTRGSPLALTQANMVRGALCAAHGLTPDQIEIVIIKTTGDQVQDRALADIGGKALWTKELDRALLSGDIDVAVHSMKDVETVRPPAIAIAAMLPRADVRDRIIGAASVDALRDGAVIGTSSPRRTAQLKRLRPDLSITLLRGNVDTRLAKVASGEIDATLLAAAGLDRLGRPDVGAAISLDVMLPAPAQGAVGIEARADASATRELLAAISDDATMASVVAERALLKALGGDCHSAMAALATHQADGMLHLRATLYAPDGSDAVSSNATGPAIAQDWVAALAVQLLTSAPPGIRSLFAA
ncbi:MAG: hydroxymethylbilane synthase [Sphingomonas sp.]